MTFALRPYQQEALDTLWRYLAARDGNLALVLPTGAGKSPLMATIAQQAVQQWQGRVGILAHVQELLQQNADKLLQMWPEAPMGLYAAGLKRKDRFDKIVVMQIQSVATRAHSFGHFDLLLIDEAHRIPLNGEGRYLKFIEACRKINPRLRVVGLTATPYRLQGAAVPVCGPDYVLNEVAYEARIGDLIRDGFLCPLVSRAGERPELGSVRKNSDGEYVEGDLARVMLEDGLVDRTVADLLARSQGRCCGIVFCVNVAHAMDVAEALDARGESVCLLYQGSPGRDDAIDGHKSGKYRWMVNVNIASEGYDNPIIDCVAMLRPTKSPGLYYQQVGRGFRLNPDKEDCLVLDYAGNVLEHGPVDAIRVKPARAGKAAEVTTAAAKECPQCSALLAIALRQCPDCAYQFTSGDPGHLDRPVDAPVLSSQRERVVNRYEVTGMKYERGPGKAGKPDHLRAIHQCGLLRFTEYVCLEHGGRARAEALRWWVARAGAGNVPRTVGEALPLAWQLPCPVAITVDETDKYPRVIGVALGERPAAAVVADVAGGTPQWLAEKLRAA